MSEIEPNNQEDSPIQADIKRTEDEEAILPEEVLEAIKELPPEARQTITRMSFQGSFPYTSPILKKITANHIDKVLDLANKDGERKAKEIENVENTKRLIIISIIVVIAIVLLYSAFTKDIELSQTIINVGIGALGGFGIGVTVSKNKE
jgi:hypothetical protein